MKKQIVLVFTAVLVFAVLFSLVPLSTALAMKDPIDVNLIVKNHTGGRVWLTLIDANGNRQYFEYTPGVFEQMELEGKYKYYASTPCGNQSGEFNLNITKDLLFSCGNGLDISLTVPVGPGPVVPTVVPTVVTPPPDTCDPKQCA